MKATFWKLKMYEEHAIDDFTSVIRVPGGALYRTIGQGEFSGAFRELKAIHTVFVPLAAIEADYTA